MYFIDRNRIMQRTKSTITSALASYVYVVMGFASTSNEIMHNSVAL